MLKDELSMGYGAGNLEWHAYCLPSQRLVCAGINVSSRWAHLDGYSRGS
jgi:hypothetical protein